MKKMCESHAKEILTQAEKGKHLIPDYMWDGVVNYLTHGIEPGSFLRAVFENNLMEAFGRANSTNRANMFEWTQFIYNYVPRDCHGSEEIVVAWLDMFDGGDDTND